MACNSDADTASDEVEKTMTVLLCDPCGEDGTILNAEGYCVDCCEHLCLTCFQHHCTPRAYRKHKLLDKYKMPRTISDKKIKDECTEECGTHAGRILECFCEEHKQFVCTLCVITGHSNCSVGYIPELSKELFDSQEFLELESNLAELKTKFQNIRLFAQENLMSTDEHAERCRERIRHFRKEINEFFETIKKDALYEVSNIEKQNKDRVVPLLDKGKQLGQEIEEIQKKVNAKREKNQKCSLFIDIKHLKKKMVQYSTDVGRLEATNKIHELAFSPSEEIKNIIRDFSKCLGSFIGFHSVISLKSDEDKKNGRVLSIAVVANDRIALTDYENQCLKLIDVSAGKLLNSKHLTDISSGITAVSDHSIALLRKDTIEIYSVTNKIMLQRTIQKTGLNDLTLTFSQNMFIGMTSSNPPSVRVVDMDGIEIKTFSGEINSRVLFKYPWYIAVNSDHSAIYVSDFGVGTVTCLSFTGELRAEYKPDYEWSPYGLAVTRDGIVYVCDYLNNNINIFTSDLQPKGVINGLRYDIWSPTGLAYCEKKQKLYVGNCGEKEVSVFSI